MPTPTQDVVVRIYEIACATDGVPSHFFTVSISLTLDEARVHDRDSDWCYDQVWSRVTKVLARDKITGDPTGATFIRERLIPASKAKPIVRPQVA